MNKTATEQVTDLENTRAAKVARMNELSKKSTDEGRTMDAAEAAEFDTTDTEVKAVDADLKRLRTLVELNKASARPVAEGRGEPGTGGNPAQGPTILTRKFGKDEAFEGQNFVRKCIAKALAKMNQTSAWHIAVQRGWDKQNPALVEIIKVGEVPGGGTGSGEWGSELVALDGRFTGDFIDFLYAQTVFDRLPLREVPANVTIKGQDGAHTAYWTGESKSIVPSVGSYMSVNLAPLKVAALSVVSNELLRDSSPAAEKLVRDSLVEASAQRIDSTFLSAAAAVAGVSPAGILNGVSATAPSGTDNAALRADIKTLYAGFITAKNAGELVFVTTKTLAKSISLMYTSLGIAQNPQLTANGGSLYGDPVYTGDNVGAGDLILLRPADIYKIGDRGVTVSMSEHATIEMNTTPTGASDTPVAASATPVGMFQTESTAFKVVRPINFALRRAGVVAFVDAGAYTG